MKVCKCCGKKFVTLGAVCYSCQITPKRNDNDLFSFEEEGD